MNDNSNDSDVLESTMEAMEEVLLDNAATIEERWEQTAVLSSPSGRIPFNMVSKIYKREWETDYYREAKKHAKTTYRGQQKMAKRSILQYLATTLKNSFSRNNNNHYVLEDHFEFVSSFHTGSRATSDFSPSPHSALSTSARLQA